MKIYVKKTSLSELAIGLMYTAIGFLGLLLTQLGDRLYSFIPPCLFHRWTGLPCPTCGATRSGISLGHFHILDAFLVNPLFFLLYAALFLWGMNTMLGVVLKKNIHINLSNREKKRVQKLLLSAIIINWLYLILITII